MAKLIFFILQLLFCQALFAQQPIPGDINNDGKIDSTDIARGLEIALGKSPPATQDEIAAGDMNRDGRITVQDLVFIRNTIAGGNRPPVADASASDDSGTVGLPVNLDASSSFDLDEYSMNYRWRQVFGPRVSFEYLSHTRIPIEDTTAAVTAFTPQALGHYKLELIVSDSSGLVSRDTIKIFVESDPAARSLAVKGVTWTDIWRNIYVPAVDSSLNLIRETGAEWVSFWYFVNVSLKDSLPAFENSINPQDPNDTPGRDVQKQIVELYHAAGFKVQWIIQLLYDHDFGWANPRPAAYYDRWKQEFREKIAVREAGFLDSLGVEMVLIQESLPIFADSSNNMNITLPLVNQLIDVFRQHYSGILGSGELLFGPPENSPDYEQIFNHSIIDFGQSEFYKQLYQNFDFVEVSFQPNITRLNDPSVEQLRSQFEVILNDYVKPLFDVVQKPVYLQVILPSFDGANKNISRAFTFFFSTDITIDFQEQVDMYEALFQAINDKPYIEGVFSRGFWYFDLNYQLDEYGNPIFDFDFSTGQRFFLAHHHSIRNKPATRALRLQFMNR